MLRGIETDAHAHEREDARIQQSLFSGKMGKQRVLIEQEIVDVTHKMENILTHAPLPPVKWRSEDERTFGARFERYKREETKHRENLARKERRKIRLEEELTRLRTHGFDVAHGQDVTLPELVSSAIAYIDTWQKGKRDRYKDLNGQANTDPQDASRELRPRKKIKKNGSGRKKNDRMRRRSDDLLVKDEYSVDVPPPFSKHEYIHLFRGQLPREAYERIRGVSPSDECRAHLGLQNVPSSLNDSITAEQKAFCLLSHVQQQHPREVAARMRGMVLRLQQSLCVAQDARARDDADLLFHIEVLRTLETELQFLEGLEDHVHLLIGQKEFDLRRCIRGNIGEAVSRLQDGTLLKAMRFSLAAMAMAGILEEHDADEGSVFVRYTHALHLLICTRQQIHHRDAEAASTFRAAVRAIGAMKQGGDKEPDAVQRSVEQAFAETKSLLMGGLSR